MDSKQLKVRVISSLWSLGTLIGIGLAGFLISSDFTKWVADTFKEYPLAISLITFLLPEVAKAIRNYFLVRKQQLGSQKAEETLLI